jgi:hypothetical protein
MSQPVTVTISVIVATCGRDTLTRTLASLAPQLEDGDEILVARRDHNPKGNATRDELMPRCAGTHLFWVDDDDVATEDALEIIRSAVAEDPDTIHVFRMESYAVHGQILWDVPKFLFGHVGGSMCVVPNKPDKLGSWVWAGGNGGDFHFLEETLKRLGREPVFHDDVIQRIRP